jgi:hypothetical protein
VALAAAGAISRSRNSKRSRCKREIPKSSHPSDGLTAPQPERAEEHRRRLERRRADDKEGIEDEDLP